MNAKRPAIKTPIPFCRYLTLVAFLPPFAGNGAQFAPAFPSVYGGYYIGFGSIYR